MTPTRAKEFRGRCTGPTCGTDVLMRLRGERYHPFDYPPETCPTCNGRGAITVHHPATMFEGEHDTSELCGTCKGAGKKYRSHFDTCPDADDFRTNKRGGARATGEE